MSLHGSQVFIHFFLHLTCKHHTPLSRVVLNLLNLDSEEGTNERAVRRLSPCAPHTTQPLCFILYPSSKQWIVPDFFLPNAPALARRSRWAEEQQAK